MAGIWTKHFTVEGKVYFYNAAQNRSLWSPPRTDSIIHEAANARPPTYLELVGVSSSYGAGVVQTSDHLTGFNQIQGFNPLAHNVTTGIDINPNYSGIDVSPNYNDYTTAYAYPNNENGLSYSGSDLVNSDQNQQSIYNYQNQQDYQHNYRVVNNQNQPYTPHDNQQYSQQDNQQQQPHDHQSGDIADNQHYYSSQEYGYQQQQNYQQNQNQDQHQQNQNHDYHHQQQQQQPYQYQQSDQPQQQQHHQQQQPINNNHGNIISADDLLSIATISNKTNKPSRFRNEEKQSNQSSGVSSYLQQKGELEARAGNKGEDSGKWLVR